MPYCRPSFLKNEYRITCRDLAILYEETCNTAKYTYRKETV